MTDSHDFVATMRRADLLAGIAFVALGVAILWLSWTMPRLEERGVPLITAPGLVPGVLGALLAACGAALALRSLAVARDPAGWRRFAAILVSVEAGRAVAVIVLVFGYALGLVGLVPFWLATALFVFAFVLSFDAWLAEVPRPLRRVAPAAALLAVATGVVVVLVFERGFLVRLP